jgi:hypothetical protein
VNGWRRPSELDDTPKPRPRRRGPRYDPLLQCFVVLIDVQLDTHTAVITIPAGAATDMNGVIKTVLAEDPLARRIDVQFEDGTLDIAYIKKGRQWHAHLPEKSPDQQQPPLGGREP